MGLKDRSNPWVTKTWVPELWKLPPTPANARRLRPATIETFLKSRRVRVVSARDVLEQFREPAITMAPRTAEAAVAHIRVIANRLQLTCLRRPRSNAG